jgi:formylglycine-generating enzyme required for sulfatase activity
MSGNALEWTRSKWGVYRYPTTKVARARREVIPQPGEILQEEDAHRVLRGGAFQHDHRAVRCACRDGGNARYLNYLAGFRVVVVRP